MTRYIVGGPERFDHQKRGLNKLIRTKGVGALLFDPGMGKTATVIDYAGLLALKSPEGEARVLVICPLVAVDTWVSQMQQFASPMVNFWAEALGGKLNLLERAEALAARGGQPFSPPLQKPRPPSWMKLSHDEETGERRAVCSRVTRKADPDDPDDVDVLCGEVQTAFRAGVLDRWWLRHAKEEHDYQPKSRPKAALRALHFDRAMAWAARSHREITPDEGPEAVGRPRIVLEVLNIDTLVDRRQVGSRTMADIMVDAIGRFDPDLVVVDESHKIKSASSNAGRLLARIAAPRRVLLTGTVMPHSPLDVFGQWRFLDPMAFGVPQPDGSVRPSTWGTFKDRFAKLGGWMGKEVVGFHHLDEMQAIMAQTASVARKQDALDLPPTTDVTIPVHLGPAETKAYKEMKDDLAAQLNSGALASVTSRLTQMLRLRQITSGHLPVDNGPVTTIGNSKAATVRSLVHDTLAGEKRIIIFALFTAEIQALERALAESGTEIMKISGETSTDERLRLRKRFGTDPALLEQRMVMIAQIKTMSLAVNELVTANHAIFASLSQQRDDYIQARDRLDRIGQTRPVTFWHAVVPGTVDEVILRSHRERTNLENAMLQHIQDQG